MAKGKQPPPAAMPNDTPNRHAILVRTYSINYERILIENKQVRAVDRKNKSAPKCQSVGIEYLTQKGHTKTEKYRALIDDQATFNFISREVVSAAELRHWIIPKETKVKIKLPDGNDCEALCRVPLQYRYD